MLLELVRSGAARSCRFAARDRKNERREFLPRRTGGADRLLCKKTGGLLRSEDLASYRAEWVEPLSVNYRGYDVFELPPNGHGITVLMALNILKAFDLGAQRERNRAYHLMIEALKLAFTDARTYVADPRAMKADVSELLSESYAAKRRALIGEAQSIPSLATPSAAALSTLARRTARETWSPISRATTSGLVPRRGARHRRPLPEPRRQLFHDPRSDNVVALGKKSYHIIPAFS